MGEFDFDIPKKRKNGGGSEFADLEPDKKRRGPRRNALWTPEDDEMFQKVYNVVSNLPPLPFLALISF
jgi:hypothetical protein